MPVAALPGAPNQPDPASVAISPARQAVLDLTDRVNQSIIGQERVVERLIIALLANGNVLIEGLPGLAKTRAIKSLAHNLEADFSRIQFTPDLLPSDVTGGEIYRSDGQGAGSFEFRQGPVFGNLVLADEINRAPAKVQSALLEAMEERQVTVAGKRYRLPDLFMVLATENPIEQEGTYPLPEAQMDRFLMHVRIDYPSDADEVKVLRLVRSEAASGGDPAPDAPKIPQQAIFDARAEIDRVTSAEAIETYMVGLIAATRRPAEYGDKLKQWIGIGASPRGSLALDRTSRVQAWLKGRDYVVPEDVQAVAHDCLRHRISPSYAATADGIRPDDIIDEVIRQVAVAA
jgi:MoxR-like ATPase